MNDISYNVVINRLKTFAEGHYMIQTFNHGQIDLMDIVKVGQNIRYPLMHVIPSTISSETGSRLFSFDIIFADLPRDKEFNNEYQREIISDCVRLAEDLINEIQNGNTLFGRDVEIQNQAATIEPFIDEHSNWLTGVTLSITIVVPNSWSSCDIPAIYSNGGEGTGLPAGLLSFEKSLVNNLGVVTLVNDVISPGNSYYYGTNASGVKGWYLLPGGGGLGTVTSVGLSMPSAFTVSGSPVTSSGTLAVTIEGTSSQYLRGDGQLATLPVTSVNSETGAVVLSAADVGADPAGSAASAIVTANAYTDSEISTLVDSVTGNIVDNTDPNNPVVTQVQSDWNSVSGLGQILNKPTLATVATSGSYNDLLDKPTISNNMLLSAQFNNTSVAASATAFFCPDITTSSATENTRQIPMPACTFKAYFQQTGSTQNAGGALTFTIRKNGVDTGVVLTIAGGSVASVYSITGQSVSFADGDLFSLKAVNGYVGGVSAVLRGATFLFEIT